MVPSSLSIIARAYPANERGWAIGQWAAYSSLTTALGPFIGGMVLSFGEDWMWRLIFAINVPIGLIALAMLYLKVPADRPVSHRRLDLIGAALATIGLGVLAWGFTEFGVKSADRLMSPLIAIGVGSALLAAFVYWESRARNPMVKLRLFRSWAFSGANLYTLLLYFAFSAAIFFLPMTIISAWRAQEWEASLLFLPVSVSIVLLSGHAGKFADRFGPRLPLAAGAMLVGIACLGMMATFPLMNLWTATFPFLVLAGIGMGLLVSPLSTAVMLATPDEDTGLGSGVNNAVARIAGLIAVAVLGAVAGLVFAANLDRTDSGFEFGAMAGQLDQAIDAARIAATNKAFQVIAGVAGVVCIAAAILAWITQPAWNKADLSG
jgi:MFS family permease